MVKFWVVLAPTLTLTGTEAGEATVQLRAASAATAV